MSLQDMKKDIISNASLNMFLNKSIKDVTIKDIGKELNIGEATIYRYYKCKENLIVECAIKLEKIVFDNYFKFENLTTGYQKIEAFYNAYYNIFNEHKEYFRFIKEFDSFLIENSKNTDLNEYEDFVDKFKNMYIDAYNQGLSDKSITKKIDNIELFYYTTSKALLELSKKEAIDKEILKSDSLIEKNNLIKELINIILKNI